MSTVEWTDFFPARTPVLALPNWESPRLMISAQGMAQRWSRSAFYPAFRLRARLRRLMLRARAATNTTQTLVTSSSEWALGAFIEEVLPETTSVSVLIGSPGPTQKTTVQLWDQQDQVIGYLKYAEKVAAKRRLAQEHEILKSLPKNLGPQVLKYGSWRDGEALLTTPLEGPPLPATLPPDPKLVDFCYQLITTLARPLEEHPWIVTHPQKDIVERWLEDLNGRHWPVVIQHGDLAWNLRQGHDAQLRAFDWEYGTMQGFPVLDLATYLLQVAVLIYRWEPARAFDFSVQYLLQEGSLALTDKEAKALVCLAAHDAYMNLEEDGYPPETPIQVWRKALCEQARWSP